MNVADIGEGSLDRQSERRPGTVYLVGAGPGDADLLTVRAHRLIQQADVLVHDRLVSEDILELAPESTVRVFVGKSASRHTLPQDEINRLLVRLAGSARTVVRLKGGDPFIFGRGGEEAEELARAGIPFEVVPGITAASGCLAALGIPLTHRGVATGARFVTGHCREGVALDLNWDSLADPDTTLVIYMGLSNITLMTRQLIAAGLSDDTPALAVAAGTTPRQKTCRSTLANLPDDVVNDGLSAPVLIVIGRVVEAAECAGISELLVERAVKEAVPGG